MLPTNKNVEFNDDGTVRRKYEPSQDSDSQIVLRSSFGMVIASAFLLVKNILTGGEKTYAGQQPQSAPAARDLVDVEHKHALADDPSAEQPEQSPSGGEKGSPMDEAPAPVRRPLKNGEPVYDIGGQAHLAGLSGEALAGNDNEAPYHGPRQRFMDDASGGGGGSARAGGGGGSGGGRGSNEAGGPGGSPGQGDPFDPGSGAGPDPVGPGSPYDEDDDGDGDTGGYPPFTANRLPVVVAPVLLGNLVVNKAILITVADLLRHALDPDGDALNIINLHASSGTLTAHADGWMFTPADNDTTDVTFSYAVGDGVGSTVQTAHLDLVLPADTTLYGTDDADRIVGTPQMDVIVARGGDDTIIGRESGDTIYAGDGDDRVVSGDGDDVVFGGRGDDIVFAGAGSDSIFGGEGNDTLFGEEGDDALFGEEGNDAIDGGGGRDAIDGGGGNDILRGGADADTVSGGEGADNMVADTDQADDVYDGGGGSDTYDASAGRADAVIDLLSGRARSDDLGEDEIEDIENAVGGGGNDILIANDRVNVLSGGGGEDVFVFRSSSTTGSGKDNRDKILDFETGDRIDLDDLGKEFASGIVDAFEDQVIRKFVLINEQSEFTKPGQLKFSYEEFNGETTTILHGNLDDDQAAEFELELVGRHELHDDVFIRPHNWPHHV